MFLESAFDMAFFFLLWLMIFNFCWPVVCWAILRKKSKDLDKRVSALEERRGLSAWINILQQQPSKHGYYEVLHDNPQTGRLVQEVAHYQGVTGRIKFWRTLPEGEK